jgi:hypothetical protein
VEDMLALGCHLSTKIKKDVSYDNRLCNAYLSAGRGAEFLDLLVRDLAMAVRVQDPEMLHIIQERFPRGGAMGLLDNHPELLDKVGTGQCWGSGSACFWASRIRIHLSEAWIRIFGSVHLINGSASGSCSFFVSDFEDANKKKFFVGTFSSVLQNNYGSGSRRLKNIPMNPDLEHLRETSLGISSYFKCCVVRQSMVWRFFVRHFIASCGVGGGSFSQSLPCVEHAHTCCAAAERLRKYCS